MSTSHPPPPPPQPAQSLIPSLSDDVALNCLARIPRSLHPILCSVSKPIRAVVSSDLLYTTRSLLNCTQSFLYISLRVPTSPSLLFFTLLETPQNKPIFIPVPPIPSLATIGSAFAVVGPKLYVIGGSINDVASAHVWALDCRFHKWEKAPSMRVAREFPAAGVVDGKIYVIGGCLVDTWARSRNWAEVFDPGSPGSDTWSPVSSGEIEVREKWMHACAVMGGKVYAMADRGGMKYDPREMSWEIVESDVDMGWRGRGCVVDGVLYCYDYLGKIRGFDGERAAWRELGGVGEKGLPKFLCGATMANVGGKLVVAWEVTAGKEMEVWCAAIEVEKGGEGELVGKIAWSDVVLKVAKGSAIVHCAAVTL